jgi:hypothetical protein
MHAADAGEGHPESAAEEQEATMFSHPDTIVRFVELRQQDLLAAADHERRVEVAAQHQPAAMPQAIALVGAALRQAVASMIAFVVVG